MKQYSEEYKQEAVRLVASRGGKIRATAEELGINRWTLKDWVEKYRPVINAERISLNQLSPAEEIKLLRKELQNVQEERDILKKAIAVFSKKPKKNIDL